MKPTPQQDFDPLSPLRDLHVASAGKGSHSMVIPFATYSPWLDDAAFLAAYEKIRDHTLVDRYRCFELWSLLRQTAKTDGDVLEVGAWRGGTGCLMAQAVKTMDLPKAVILCDTFSGVVKAGDEDATYRGGEHADTSTEVVRDLAARVGVDGIVEILPGIFPEETGMQVADRRFSLCHIDVDVYASARDVTAWVWPRLSVGGCIVYDDYGFMVCDGVTRLVNEMMPLAGGVMMYNLNGHAVIVKVAPTSGP